MIFLRCIKLTSSSLDLILQVGLHKQIESIILVERTGVTKGLAGVKLSGSPRRYGSFSDNVDSTANRITNSTISFVVK
jgi:hypothetical protein